MEKPTHCDYEEFKLKEYEHENIDGEWVLTKQGLISLFSDATGQSK